jgi:prevent-host-death family protein
MDTVNIHEAKTHLSRLLARAARGESFIIAKAGKPLAKVVPYVAASPTKAKRIGFLAGQIRVPADFDRLGDREIENLFGGGS